MKIIRQRAEPNTTLIRFDCQTCESLLEAQISEAISTDTSYQGTFLTFKCPVCKKLTVTEKK